MGIVKNILTSGYLIKDDVIEFLTDEEVIQFQQLVLQIYGKVLTLEEARDQAAKLVMAFDLMLDNLDTIDNDKN